MTDRQEEQAALHALHMLDAHEMQILHTEMRTDPRLRDLVAELEDAAAQIILAVPEEDPPEGARAVLIKTLKQRRRANVKPLFAPLRVLRSPWIAWAAALLVLIIAQRWQSASRRASEKILELAQSEATARSESAKAAGTIAQITGKLEASNAHAAQISAELASLKQVNALVRMELASLRATVKRFDEGVAVIVWDSEKQEGKLRLEKIPPVQVNKDYQLWVIDKKNPAAPVSAGVVKVDAKGFATVTFKPVAPVAQAAKFALSIEALGGVAKKSTDGPIVFAGP